ncbi:HD family phosphohydrolase [Nostocaceae cyanobacterium CENA357]|uniref:HD family phosphohydrolase n=1 Tax=Atlanticothrix silvestris CENA357 TaxID=1725252 RepID=A0A8J7L6C5_9CYAN|nr:HD family phosphohydrolase [Atlanticothrix silvestris]MBH8555572.1 HD family phosphohydrolase [Atlanticothrix silvestris CENA357]
MKTQRFLRSLNQRWTHWRRRYKALRRKSRLLVKVRSQSSKNRRQRFLRNFISDTLLFLIKITANNEHRKRKIVVCSMAKSVNQRRGINTLILDWVHKKRFSVVLAIAILSLTGVVGHKLYNRPQLQVGNIAPQTIRAPYTATIEDRRETEAQRKAVSRSSIPVLIVDARITEKIDQNLQQLLNEGDEIRAAAGPFPFFDTSVLSISSQHYLRSCSVSEWQALVLALENTSKHKYSRGSQATSPKSDLSTPYSPLPTQKTDFTQAVAELETYRLTTSEQNLFSLIAQISQSRQAYTQASVQLLQLETNDSDTIYNGTVVLNLSDDEWTRTQIGIRQSAERILAQGIPSGLLPSILQNAVSLQVQTFVPKNAESLATKLLLAVLQPNLTKDEEQTKQQAQQAAAGVTPVMIEVHQGQVIVAKGKNISAWHFEVLEHYQLIRRENNWLGLGKLAAVVTGAIGIFVWVEKRIKCELRQRDRLLVLLLTLSTPGVLALGIPYTSWSAVGLLLGSFYGPSLGVTVMGLLLLILRMNSEISMIALLAGAAGGILGSCIAQKLRSREELALLGLAIALTQGIIYLIAKILIGAVFSAGWYIVLQEAGFFALSGLVWSVVALGLSPYLEKLFDLVTPIRLAELANPNRPLLKRLATETPGTFQHTLFVSTLAEAAAKKLGCNVELVRAGTLYHDIGKMHDPLGFIENQMGGPNKHETEINDPWKSAAIIKKHVSEGLVMARKHLVPTAIQAFIPEHQGTMLIAYFYHQAQQMAEENPSLVVDEVEFRYDGPIPQSRETGIVMLADSCEAALRSLKDATPEQALSMLNNILRARWQDDQMIDSGLTREEMSQIAQIFVDVWQQFHHKRIAYPKLKASNEKLAQS